MREVGEKAPMTPMPSHVPYSEKLLEDFIRDYPREFLDEPFSLDSQQLRLAGFRPDLVFLDSDNIPTIVEVQIGQLDRNHLYRILEYRDLLLLKGEHAKVRVILVANALPERYRSLLSIHGIELVVLSTAIIAEKVHKLRPDLVVQFDPEGESPFRSLGPVSAALVSLWQTDGRTVVRPDPTDRAKLKITAKQEREALFRLCRSGWIARIQKGVYLVHKGVDLQARFRPSPFRIIQELMTLHSGNYQIVGPAAFRYHGWLADDATSIHVYNDRISRRLRTEGRTIEFIKVASGRLGDVERAALEGGCDVTFSSRLRSLIDAVYEWDRFASLPDAFVWLWDEVEKHAGAANALAQLGVRYGNVGTQRRLGKALEVGSANPTTLALILSQLPPTTAKIPWAPSLPSRGMADRRWGLVLNFERHSSTERCDAEKE